MLMCMESMYVVGECNVGVPISFISVDQVVQKNLARFRRASLSGFV